MKRFKPELVALVAVIAGIALRAALNPVLGPTQIWLTFWPAVFLAAWYGGRRAGIEAVLASVAIVEGWLVTHEVINPERVLTGAIVFAVCGIAFAFVSEMSRQARFGEIHHRKLAEDAERDERRHREAILAYATALASAKTPHGVALVMIDHCRAALGADVCAFARWIDDATAELVASHGFGAKNQRFPLTMQAPLPLAMRMRTERFVETEAAFREVFPDAVAVDDAHAAAASLPLVVDDRVLGAVAVRFKAERTFSDEDRDILRTLVAQAAQAFDRASLLEAEQQSNRMWRALIELSTLLASAQSVDDAAQIVVTEGLRAAAADTAMLYIVDEATQTLRLVLERGCAPDVVATIREIPLASEHGRTLSVEQMVEGSEQYAAMLPSIASIPSPHRRAAAFWSMPLMAGGRLIGVLAMGFYELRRFSTDEREFVRLFSQHCAQAIARAERATGLEREQVRLTRIFEANQIGAVFWTRGKIVRANDSFLHAIGRTRHELETAGIDWAALTPPEYAETDRAAVESVRKTGFHEPYEKEFVHADGHRVPVLVSSAAFYDDPTQGITYAADLTEVKRAAGAANRAKDDFLAMLGHELRNPLAPITTALELIELRGLANADRPLGIIKRQVHHLTRMVDDLLDVSRIKTGKVQLSKKKIEVHEVITRSIEMVSPLLEERRHRLVIDVPANGLLVDVDGTRISQVFANIIANAAKYTDPQGELRISALAEGSEIVVDVTDNGVGIDPLLLRRIFDVFTQEPQSIERSRGGLGLGLAIARLLVDAHGGTLTAHSDGRGKGSRFTVRLARAIDSQLTIAQPLDAPRIGGSSKRVLVVDDNRDAADLLATLAEHRGHAARRAGDGPDALRILRDFTPDVALLDIGLPVMDGYELAQRIREIPHLSSIRLVAVTGYGQPSDREKARAAGFDDHLVKPVQLEDVVRAIEE